MFIIIDKFNGPFLEQSRCLFFVEWWHLVTPIFFYKKSKRHFTYDFSSFISTIYVLTFRNFKTCEMNGLHIVHKGWNFRTGFAFLLMIDFFGLQRSSCWHNCCSSLCWLIITWTIRVRWTGALFRTLTHILKIIEHEKNTIIKNEVNEITSNLKSLNQ